MGSNSRRKISVNSSKGGFTKKFDLKDRDNKGLIQIELGVTTDNYNNPILHISVINEEIFENPNTLEYDLITFCEDVARGYLEGSYEEPEGVYEICKSLRRAADALEYKYRKD